MRCKGRFGVDCRRPGRDHSRSSRRKGVWVRRVGSQWSSRGARWRASVPNTRRWRAWPRRRLSDLAVELHGREKRCGRPENLVGSAQLANLTFQLHDPGRIVAGGARPSTAVDLGLPNPGPQCFSMDTQLVSDPLDRPRARRRIPTGIQRHPGRPLPQLVAVLLRCCHDSHRSWHESLRQTRDLLDQWIADVWQNPNSGLRLPGMPCKWLTPNPPQHSPRSCTFGRDIRSVGGTAPKGRRKPSDSKMIIRVLTD